MRRQSMRCISRVQPADILCLRLGTAWVRSSHPHCSRVHYSSKIAGSTFVSSKLCVRCNAFLHTVDSLRLGTAWV